MAGLGFRPVGRAALLVEVVDIEVAQAAYRVIRRLVADGLAGLAPPRDVVPAARTVLLDGLTDVPGWEGLLRSSADAIDLEAKAHDDRVRSDEIVLTTRYDGPDLAVVAKAWGCSSDEVVRRHLAARFRVAFCGFAPGFAYCTSDLQAPNTPRRDEPRTAVPAGSVALGGAYCGVYPRTMPGGWQLIGTTDATVFDPDRDDPALLHPGDKVRFEAAA